MVASKVSCSRVSCKTLENLEAIKARHLIDCPTYFEGSEMFCCALIFKCHSAGAEGDMRKVDLPGSASQPRNDRLFKRALTP